MKKNGAGKKNKIKCMVCEKRIATLECCCGLKFCRKCFLDNGENCPDDEGIEHWVEKLK